MNALLVALVLASAPTERVLVLNPSTSVDLPVEFFANLVGETLNDRGLAALTSADLKKLAELGAERQLLDCDTSSCLSELAGAMGARYVVFGEAGRVGGQVFLSLALYDAEAAKPIQRRSLRAERVEDLDEPIREAARSFARALRGDEVPWAAVATTGAGVALVAGGTVALIAAELTFQDGSLDAGTREGARALAPVWLGVALAGAAIAVGGGVWWAVE